MLYSLLRVMTSLVARVRDNHQMQGSIMATQYPPLSLSRKMQWRQRQSGACGGARALLVRVRSCDRWLGRFCQVDFKCLPKFLQVHDAYIHVHRE